jgi:hypothetical protein
MTHKRAEKMRRLKVATYLISYLCVSRCDVLSFKDGQCYLHRAQEAGFYTDASMGHLTQRVRSPIAALEKA